MTETEAEATTLETPKENNRRSVVTISAAWGGNAEAVLREIAKTENSQKYYRKFGPWLLGDGDTEECRGVVGRMNESIVSTVTLTPVVLVLGGTSGVLIKGDGGSKWHPYGTRSGLVVRVGSLVPSTLIPNIAQQVLAWVSRGDSWIDNRNDVHQRPYGKPAISRSITGTWSPACSRTRYRPQRSFLAPA